MNKHNFVQIINEIYDSKMTIARIELYLGYVGRSSQQLGKEVGKIVTLTILWHKQIRHEESGRRITVVDFSENKIEHRAAS